MNRNSFSYIGTVLLFSAVLAFSPSTLTLALCAVLAAVLALFCPPSALLLSGAVSFAVMLICWGDPIYAIGIVLSYLLTGVVIALCIKKSRTFLETFSCGAAVYLVCDVAGTYFMAKSAGYTVIQALVDVPCEQARQVFLSMLTQIDTGGQMSAQVNSMMDELTEIMRQMLPAVLVIGALVFSLIVIIVLRFWLKKMGIKISLKTFSSLRADVTVTVISAALCAAAFLVHGTIGIILKNVAVILVFVYAALGVAALLRILAPMAKKLWHRALIIAAVFVFLNFVAMILGTFIAANSIRTGILILMMPVAVFAVIGIIGSFIPGKVE